MALYKGVMSLSGEMLQEQGHAEERPGPVCYAVMCTFFSGLLMCETVEEKLYCSYAAGASRG